MKKEPRLGTEAQTRRNVLEGSSGSSTNRPTSFAQAMEEAAEVFESYSALHRKVSEAGYHGQQPYASILARAHARFCAALRHAEALEKAERSGRVA